MSWWSAAPAVVLCGAAWLLPGWAALRALGARGLVAWAGGPAVTAAVVGGLTVLYGELGVPWRPATAAIGAAFAIGVLAGVRRRWLGGPPPAPFVPGMRLALTITLIAAAVLIGGPMVAAMEEPARSAQAWDAVFHLNAITLLRQAGNASALGALSPLYGASLPYYPTVYHAVAALLPVDVAVAANVQNVVFAAVVWPLGVAVLVRAVPGAAAAAVVAPLVAATFVAFPTVAFTLLAAWPFALSVALLPGALAVVLRTLHAPTPARIVGATVGGAGVILAHGSGAFSMLLLAAPAVAVNLARWLRNWWCEGRPRQARVTAGAAALAAGLVAVFVLRWPQLVATLRYERAASREYVDAAVQLLTDHPFLSSFGPVGIGNAVVTALAAVGAVVTFRRRQGRWLVLGWLGAGVLTVLAAGPEGHLLRGLAGFWYTQPARLAALAAVPTVVLASLGAVAATARVVRWLRQRRSVWGLLVRDTDEGVDLDDRAGRVMLSPGGRILRAAAPVALLAVVLAATAGRWDLKERVTASVYEPGHVAWGTMLSAEEIGLMPVLGERLGPDAVVLGDPFNGSAYLPALAGIDVVFPQLGPVRGAAAVLAERGDELYTDPAVCAAAQELGVTHLYRDAEQPKRHKRTAALSALEPPAGARLVAEAGTAQVWRLPDCSEG